MGLFMWAFLCGCALWVVPVVVFWDTVAVAVTARTVPVAAFVWDKWWNVAFGVVFVGWWWW